MAMELLIGSLCLNAILVCYVIIQALTAGDQRNIQKLNHEIGLLRELSESGICRICRCGAKNSTKRPPIREDENHSRLSWSVPPRSVCGSENNRSDHRSRSDVRASSDLRLRSTSIHMHSAESGSEIGRDVLSPRTLRLQSVRSTLSEQLDADPVINGDGESNKWKIERQLTWKDEETCRSTVLVRDPTTAIGDPSTEYLAESLEFLDKFSSGKAELLDKFSTGKAEQLGIRADSDVFKEAKSRRSTILDTMEERNTQSAHSSVVLEHLDSTVRISVGGQKIAYNFSNFCFIQRLKAELVLRRLRFLEGNGEFPYRADSPDHIVFSGGSLNSSGVDPDDLSGNSNLYASVHIPLHSRYAFEILIGRLDFTTESPPNAEDEIKDPGVSTLTSDLAMLLPDKDSCYHYIKLLIDTVEASPVLVYPHRKNVTTVRDVFFPKVKAEDKIEFTGRNVYLIIRSVSLAIMNFNALDIIDQDQMSAKIDTITRENAQRIFDTAVKFISSIWSL